MMKLLFDQDGSVLTLSSELPGFSESSAGKLSFEAIVHPEDFRAVDQVIRDAAQDQLPFLTILRVRDADSAFTWSVLAGAPSFSPVDGSVIGYLGHTVRLDDISDPRLQGSIAAPGTDQRSGTMLPFADSMAQHVIVAHSIAKTTNNAILRPILELALLTIAKQIVVH